MLIAGYCYWVHSPFLGCALCDRRLGQKSEAKLHEARCAGIRNRKTVKKNANRLSCKRCGKLHKDATAMAKHALTHGKKVRAARNRSLLTKARAGKKQKKTKKPRAAKRLSVAATPAGSYITAV